MNRDELLNLSAKLLGISADEAKANNRNLTDINAIYVWDPRSRGGGRLIIEPNGSFLYAIPTVSFEEHVKDFVKGVRTDPKLFDL